MSTLQDFRTEKDHFLLHIIQSTLSIGLVNFTVWRISQIIPAWAWKCLWRFRVLAGRFESPPRQVIINHTIAIVYGQVAGLTIYHNKHGFFLPFVYALVGTETYLAVHYLEVKLL